MQKAKKNKTGKSQFLNDGEGDLVKRDKKPERFQGGHSNGKFAIEENNTGDSRKSA